MPAFCSGPPQEGCIFERGVSLFRIIRETYADAPLCRPGSLVRLEAARRF